MDLTKFRYIVEIERRKSISKAAKELYIAQPNLSKIVKEIENEYGITIFQRTPSGVLATPDGYMFIHRIKGILDKVDQMKEEYITQKEKGLTLNITIPRASYIASAFTDYLSRNRGYGRMAIRLCESNSMTAINNILDQGFHFGIIRYDMVYELYYISILKLKGLKYEVLFDFHYLLLMSDKNRLCKKSEITEDDLADQVEIIHGDTVLPNGEYIDIFEEADEHRRKYICVYERGSQFDLLTRLDNAYMWVSPLTPDTLGRYGLVQKSCVFEKREMRDMLVYASDYRMKEFEKGFVSELKELIRTLEN